MSDNLSFVKQNKKIALAVGATVAFGLLMYKMMSSSGK